MHTLLIRERVTKCYPLQRVFDVIFYETHRANDSRHKHKVSYFSKSIQKDSNNNDINSYNNYNNFVQKQYSSICIVKH